MATTLLTTGAFAADLGGSLGGEDNNSSSLSNFARGKLQDYSEPATSLKSDATPYVADFLVNDSLYKVGPGDYFQIFVESATMERQVNAEGNIVLNRIGIAHVDGLSLRAAENLILDRLQTAHKRTNCFVNLSRPKMMRIFVTGAVKDPGIYEVPGNYRLSDGLREAKGFSLLAQKSDIRIVSQDGQVQQVNLRKFSVNGDLQSNPYLTQGCVIQAPFMDYSQPTASIKMDSGSFVVQLEPDETVLDVMLKANSFKPPAPYSAVLLREKDGKEQLLTPGEVSSYKPSAGSSMEVLSSRQEVFVGGAVSKPGFQAYNSNHKIIQYISEAGLITSSKIPHKIEVIRKNGSRENVPIEEALYPGDMVYVDQNGEQRFLLYTPVILSFVSLTLALLSLKGL